MCSGLLPVVYGQCHTGSDPMNKLFYLWSHFEMIPMSFWSILPNYYVEFGIITTILLLQGLHWFSCPPPLKKKVVYSIINLANSPNFIYSTQQIALGELVKTSLAMDKWVHFTSSKGFKTFSIWRGAQFLFMCWCKPFCFTPFYTLPYSNIVAWSADFVLLLHVLCWCIFSYRFRCKCY